MAKPSDSPIPGRPLQRLKSLDKLVPLFDRLQDVGCQRDRAGNRELRFRRQYGTTGPVRHGRSKAFPVRDDDHLVTVRRGQRGIGEGAAAPSAGALRASVGSTEAREVSSRLDVILYACVRFVGLSQSAFACVDGCCVNRAGSAWSNSQKS
jgi:hypothetical protein